MFADTKHPDKEKAKGRLSRLSALFSTAVTLLQKDVRSEAMVETLLRALQLFKENRLIAVVSRQADKTSLPNAQELLSLRIDDLSLSDSTKLMCREKGVAYLGEVGQLPWRHYSFGKSKGGAELQGFLVSIGLDAPPDPFKLGWVPPYWEDSAFLEALDAPIMTLCNTENFWPWQPLHRFWHRHYIGQMLRQDRSVGRKELFLRNMTKAPEFLRGGMLVPRSWQPPAEVPQVWLDYLAEREKLSGEEDNHPRPTLAEIIDWPLNQFEFSARVASVFQRYTDIRSLRDLITRSEHEILCVRQIGRAALEDIKAVVESYGVHLGMTEEEIQEILQTN